MNDTRWKRTTQSRVLAAIDALPRGTVFTRRTDAMGDGTGERRSWETYSVDGAPIFEMRHGGHDEGFWVPCASSEGSADR